MEQQISGREIMLFITIFKLWDAYVEADNHPAGSFELRAPGFGCDECSYTLYNNGQYEIEAWIQEKEDDDGRWELVQTGDIYKLERAGEERIMDNERKETISALRQLLAMCDFVDQYGDSIDEDPYFDAVETAIESLNETRWIPVNER